MPRSPYIKTNPSNQSRSDITIRIYYDEKLFTRIKPRRTRDALFVIYVFTECLSPLSLCLWCEKALSTLFFPQSSHTLTWKFTSMDDGRQQIIRPWARWARSLAPDFTLRVGPPAPRPRPAPAIASPINILTEIARTLSPIGVTRFSTRPFIAARILITVRNLLSRLAFSVI